MITQRIKSFTLLEVGDVKILIIPENKEARGPFKGISCDIIVVPDNLSEEEYAAFMPCLKENGKWKEYKTEKKK